MSEPTEQVQSETGAEPQTEGAPPAKETNATDAKGGDAAQQPPWQGKEFDPEKAWNLIQNLRKETSEKGAKLRAYEDEKLTVKEKADRDLSEAREQLAAVQRDNAYAQARAAHPVLTDSDMQFIGQGTPEEIAERATALATRLEAQAAANARHINPVLRADPTGGTDPTSHRSKDPIRDMLANR